MPIKGVSFYEAEKIEEKASMPNCCLIFFSEMAAGILDVQKSLSDHKSLGESWAGM